MKQSRWFALILFCVLAVLPVLTACSSDEPTERRQSSESERETTAPPSDSGRVAEDEEGRSEADGESSDVLSFVPADAESVAWLDVERIRRNRNRFPGNFRTFESELVEKIEDEFDTGVIGFDQVDHFVRFKYDGSEETLVVGARGFDEMRDEWEEQGKVQESYRGYETWSTDIVVFESDGAILTAGRRELLDSLADAPGPLSDADGTDLGIILDELGNSPAIFVDVDQNYGCDLDECLGYGATFAKFDADRQWIHVDLVMLFSDERIAAQSVDENVRLVREMNTFLHDIAWEMSDYIGVSEFGITVEEGIESDGELVVGTAIIWLSEGSAPPPTSTPVRPTRVPAPSPIAEATPPPGPQATPFAARPTEAPPATPAPTPTPSPRATGGPGAVYRGDGNWASLAGPAVGSEYQDYEFRRLISDLGGEDAQVPLDAILQHKWIFESDYYQSLVQKARLNNPTPLLSSGQSITLVHSCISQNLYWCRHLDTYFAPNVEERTNGQVKIEISSFPELGLSGLDTAVHLGDGSLAMAEVHGGYVSGEFPVFTIQDLWGLWPNDQSRYEAQAAMTQDLDLIVADEMGGQVLFRNWFTEGGYFLFTKDALETPNDLEGLRIRSFGAAQGDWIRGMGGEPRLVSFGEVDLAVSRGVVDAIAINARAARGGRPEPRFMNGPLYGFDSSINAVNREVWNSIPSDLQQILIEEGAKQELEALRLASVQGNFFVERISSYIPVEFSPEVRAKSRQVARECVIPGWLKRIGYASTGGCTGPTGSAASPATPQATPSWQSPVPTPTAAERQVLSARGARAVDIFNRTAGPIVGLRINADGTVTELR